MTTGPARVLVLGGGGFVGGAAARAIAASTAFSVVVASRRAPPPGLAWPILHCDATDPLSLERALQATDCVVNAVLASGGAMRRATRLLCALAPRAGVRRIVHVSSMAVYGGRIGLVEETTALQPDDATYAGAKVACETAVRGAIAQGTEAVILRPGLVYGPGGQQWTGRLCRLLRARRLGDLGAAGDGLCNLIHADDVGAAILTSLQAPEAVGQAINLASPDPPRWNDVLMRLGRAIGAVPVPRIGRTRLAMEARLLAWPLRAGTGLARRLGLPPGALPEPLPRSLLTLFGQEIRLDHRRADAWLGFARTDDKAGLDAAAAWFSATQA